MMARCQVGRSPSVLAAYNGTVLPATRHK